MKLILEGQNLTCTTLKALAFAPEVDLTGQTLPINEFTADVETGEDIQTGQFARLLDGRDNLWARYWVTKAERKTLKLTSIRAQSPLVWLDRTRMPAKYLSGASLGGEIDYCFDGVADVVGPVGGYCVIDSAIANRPVYGWLPEQSARERLQTLLMSACAYIRTWNDPEMRVLDAPDMWNAGGDFGTLIPEARTFWRPGYTQKDPPSHVTLKYYSVAPGEPGPGQSGVKDDYGNVYAVTEGESGATISGALGSEVTVSGNMLIDCAASQSVFPQLMSVYKADGRVEADIVNNAEIWPGDRVTFQMDEEGKRMCTGYVNAVSFAFGVQARSRLRLDAATLSNAARVTFNWQCGGRTVYTETVSYPAGYGYSRNLVDQKVIRGRHLLTYRPQNPTAEGDAGAQATTRTVDIPCDLVSDTDLFTGETVTDFTPHHIAVTTSPARLVYKDGDAIDFSGMVVKLYNAEGQLLNLPGVRNGVIPTPALTLPVTVADIDAVESDRYRSRDREIEALRMMDYIVTDDMTGTGYRRTDAIYLTDAIPPPYDNIYLGSHDNINGAVFLATFYDGHIWVCPIQGDMNFRHIYQQPYNGSFYYYGNFNHPPRGWEYGHFYDIGLEYPIREMYLPISDVDPTEYTLDEMVRTDGGQTIPVRWTVPGGGDVLEASFQITVAPGYGGEDEM